MKSVDRGTGASRVSVPQTELPKDRLEKGWWRTLVALALPLIGQNLINFGVTLSDNLMVGTLGEASINGLYLATVVQMVLMMLLFGVESAILVLSTQYWGKRDIVRIKTIIAMALRVSLCGAAVFAAVAMFLPAPLMRLMTPSGPAAAEAVRYLRIVGPSFLFFCVTHLLVVAMRSVEVVRVGFLNSCIAFVVNIGLNYVFIFGKLGVPAMGVAGAAAATTVSRFLEMSFVLFYLFRVDTALRFRPRDFLLGDRALGFDLVRYGTPLLLGQVTWAVNKSVMRGVVGRFDPSAMTAVSITDNFDNLLWCATVGLAAAMGILTGKMIGAERYGAVKAYARRMQLVFVGVGFVAAAAVFFGHGFFTSFYTFDPATAAKTAETTARFFTVLLFVAFFRSYQAPCLMGLVKSGGDTKFVFINDTIWVFCWVLPSAIVAQRVFHAPDIVVYTLLLSDQFTKCFVALVKINRFRWMRNLTRA